jgi:DNA-binding CsgD family transcriptional regulator
MKRDCRKCTDRPTCKKLCKEAEVYVNQDYVPQREITIGLPGHAILPLQQISNIPLTGMERKIVTLLGQKLSRADVCQILGISRGTLRIHIWRMRGKK